MSEVENIVKIPSLIEYNGEYSMDVYVLKFPEDIYFKFLNKYKDDNSKKRNMKIAELNSGLQSYLTDIYYTNFIKKANLDEGWIFSSNDDYLDEIKHQLNLWLDKVGLKDCENLVECLEFEKREVRINNDDIRKNNVNCKLLLSYLSKDLAEKINYSIKVNEVESLDLEFIYVNNDDRFRVLALFPDRKVNVNNNDYYYNYYFELYPVELDKNENPYIGINVGKLMMAYKSADTYDSNIYPYIIINSQKSEGDFKVTAFKGLVYKITNGKYKWSSFVEYVVDKTIDKSLPEIKKLIDNPIDYIDSNLDLSVLIPHGTHMNDVSHNVGSGVDLKKRISMLKVITDELNRYGMFGECIYLKMDDKRNNLGLNEAVASNKEDITLNLFYTNNETKDLFEKYISFFNNRELVLLTLDNINKVKKEIALVNKKLRKIKDEIKSLEGKSDKNNEDISAIKSLKDNQEILKEERSKLNQNKSELEDLIDVDMDAIDKIYRTLTGKKVKTIDKCPTLKINAIDFSKTNPYNIARTKSAQNIFEREFSQLECDKELGVSIVELENKDYFSRRYTVDPKSNIRKIVAKQFNKTTQFTSPIREEDDSKYSKINKIILECFRQLGYVHTRDKISEDTAYIGITKESSDIIMTCVIGKKTYGKYRNYPWMSYTELLILLSSINKKEEYSYNASYIEDSIDEVLSNFNISNCVVLMLNRHLKSLVPYMKYETGNFNLKIGKSEDLDSFTEYKNNKVTVVFINDTIDAEWFKMDENGEIDETKFSMILSQINERLFVSICSGRQGVMQSYMGDNCEIYREDSKDTVKEKISKSEPIFMYFAKTAYNYDNLSIARDLHFSKTDTSIQHCGAGKGVEETKLPLALNISILAGEFLI